MPTGYKKIIVLFSCFAFLHVLASAEDNTTKLKSLDNQITKVKTDLTQKEQQHTSVKQKLNNLKKKIMLLEADYRSTEKKLKRQKEVLGKLTKDQARQQSKLKEAQNKLSDQINLAYQIEGPNYFKNFFEEKKVNSGLFLDYHKYVFVARLAQMHDINKTLENLRRNRDKIKQQTKDLEKLESKQQQQKLELEKTKQEQNEVLSSLKNKITTQNKKLKQLLVAKRNLERLVDTLVPRMAGAMSSESKTKVCRNFVWPTKGRIITHFGSPIEQSSWKWNGVVISATENQDIYAISPGKVVYADWLAGYGLLLIIDHGSGYMSLYGHNSSFRKRLNASVEAGEVVAAVGKSGCEEPELYFAIRYNGKPIDPEKWCR